jgi:hypothetical protein
MLKRGKGVLEGIKGINTPEVEHPARIKPNNKKIPAGPRAQILFTDFTVSPDGKFS